MRPRVLWDARKAADFGIGTYITGLLEGLVALDRFELLAVGRREDTALIPAGVTLVPSKAPHYSLRELFDVRQRIVHVQPDLFHAPHYVVPLFPPKRTVVTIHDLMHLTRPEHSSALKQAYAKRMLGRAAGMARVITVSEATRLEVARFWPGARTVVIPNGVGPRFSPSVPAVERSRIRREHGLSMPYLLFLGNDKPHKNVRALLEAFSLHRRFHPTPHHLVLAGGSRRAALLAQGLAGVAHDLGRVPDRDLPPLVAEADAVILPSLAEGFGLPVLEAQATGTPVACSNRGGLLEAAGDAAVLFDPESPEEMAEAIRTVLTDEPLRRDLVRRGLERAADLTWKRVAERTAAVYAEVLA